MEKKDENSGPHEYEITLKIHRDPKTIDHEQKAQMLNIFEDLVDSGAMWGVFGGQTVLNFDKNSSEYRHLTLNNYQPRRQKSRRGR